MKCNRCVSKNILRRDVRVEEVGWFKEDYCASCGKTFQEYMPKLLRPRSNIDEDRRLFQMLETQIGMEI